MLEQDERMGLRGGSVRAEEGAVGGAEGGGGCAEHDGMKEEESEEGER